MRQRLQPYLRHLTFLLLALVVGVVDILLLAGAVGGLGRPPDPAVQAAQIQDVTQQMSALRRKIENQRFPPVNQVENLVLSLAEVAKQGNVQITAFGSARQVEQLSGRTYPVVVNTLELRGAASDLIGFLEHLQRRTVETLEVRNVTMRSETGVWILQAEVRILAEQETQQ